ncbi:cyclin-dependent kinase inhibitor 3-like [Phragmites australis]|uniref:cyclin-dependent kinase inhibitor 3-like n=1 Tax=Phragmites australis TaxID=29695 RepID=UPI002D78F827|nr:cyclin-dependent kinase inhibitor 3-like [Phragmites australis]
MGKFVGSCGKQQCPPAAFLTLRSGRRVPATAACSSGSRRLQRGAAGPGRRPCAKSAARRWVLVGSQREELPSSHANSVVRDADGCGVRLERDAPLSDEASKHDLEANDDVGRRSSPSPLEAEMEAFFAAAELAERRRFAEAYNYDVALDRPLDGRFEWAPVST